MDYKKSTLKVFNVVSIAKTKKRKRISSPIPVQKIQVDEQTKNDFELTHHTTLKNPMIYLVPDSAAGFSGNALLIAYALSNKIHIKKSKYNPGSTETKEILEHELTHVQQYSEGRLNESVDELELEATFNETRHIKNGQEVHYIEYAPGKYCEATQAEYKLFLIEIANNFESEVESTLRRIPEEKQLDFILELERWANSCDDKFFDLKRWW